MSYHDRQQSGRVLARITSDVGSLLIFLDVGSLQLASDLVLALGISAVLLATDWRLALATLAVMPLYALNNRLYSGRVRSLAHDTRARMAAVYGLLSERVSAVRVVRSFVQEGRHQGLLDDILRAVHQTLTSAETMAVIREKIRAELPTLLRLYRADRFLVNRIVASATHFFEEVRNDPDHPFRGEFNHMLLSLVDKLGSDPAFASRIDGLKRDILARP